MWMWTRVGSHLHDPVHARTLPRLKQPFDPRVIPPTSKLQVFQNGNGKGVRKNLKVPKDTWLSDSEPLAWGIDLIATNCPVLEIEWLGRCVSS